MVLPDFLIPTAWPIDSVDSASVPVGAMKVHSGPPEGTATRTLPKGRESAELPIAIPSAALETEVYSTSNRRGLSATSLPATKVAVELDVSRRYRHSPRAG